MFQDDVDDLNNFVVEDVDDDDEEEEASSTGDSGSASEAEQAPEVKKRNTRGNNDGENLIDGLDTVKAEELANQKGWWNRFLGEEDDLEKYRNRI